MAINNYTVGTSKFTPYTYEELLRVPQQMTEYHNKLEAENLELMNKAELLDYYISQNPDSQSASMYNKFKKMYESAADDLTLNGLNNGVARTNALNLRKAYNSLITPLASGVERMLAAKKLAKADQIGSLGTLDDYVLDPTYTPTYLSAADITEALKDSTLSLSKSMAPRQIESDDPQYNRYFNGVHPDDIQIAYAYISNPEATVAGEGDTKIALKDIADPYLVNQILQARESYGYNQMNATDKQKVDYAMLQGMKQGLGTIESRRNLDYLNPLQRHNMNKGAVVDDDGNAVATSGSGSSSQWTIPGDDITLPESVKKFMEDNDISRDNVRVKITGEGVFKYQYRKDANSEWISSNIYNTRGELYDSNKVDTQSNKGTTAWMLNDKGELEKANMSAQKITEMVKKSKFKFRTGESPQSHDDEEIGTLQNAVNDADKNMPIKSGTFYYVKKRGLMNDRWYFVPDEYVPEVTEDEDNKESKQNKNQNKESNFNPIENAK